MNDYFTFKKVPYVNMTWEFVSAKKDLLIVVGKIHDQYVAIRQYRPPLRDWVISFPMGAFPKTESLEELIDIAKTEAEGETGQRIDRIRYGFKFARSPGLTDEIAHVFFAEYAPDEVPQNLHEEEEIEKFLIHEDEVGKLFEGNMILDSSMLMVFNTSVAKLVKATPS